MASGSRLRASVLAAKKRLAEGREQLRLRHLAGGAGVQVCARLTDLLDETILGLYEAAIADLKQAGHGGVGPRVALVPHGGYGRRDVAPFSDVDLMILHAPEVGDDVAPLAERMMRDLFDAGLDLGHSVRTAELACALASTDATICTSLVEARYLAGSANLFAQFAERFQRETRRRRKTLVEAIEKARLAERAQFGETLYLLEPNLKRSRGGLRDIHLLRWVGFARHGVSDPCQLHAMGVLSAEDRHTIESASEFLLRLRNEMHFHAGRARDVLDRAEQVRLAEVFRFEGEEGLLPVEQFMREYFRRTRDVTRIVSHFVANAHWGSAIHRLVEPLLSHRVEGDYRVGPSQIAATRRGLAKLRESLTEVLRLVDLANLYDKRIAQPTWDAVRQAASRLPDPLSPEATGLFLSFLSQSPRLGELLHRLHELGVLEKIIPAFTHARCLLQFNMYHKYTVDEHSLRAVVRATEFQTDPGPLGRVYRSIKEKRILHLALLLHDLGKGYPEDHSQVGLRIAEETAARLRLAPHEAETLKFLVHRHLLMNHLAFRRDTSDDQLIVRFAVEVGSPEVLRMLYVLTAADLGAVGPGVWTNWKAEVVTELYRRTMQHLAGESPAVDSEEWLNQRRQEILARLAEEEDHAWFEERIGSLPAAYLQADEPERSAAELRALRGLAARDVFARGRYLPESHTVEYTIAAHEEIAPGVFHRLAGALASQGVRILAAEINTLAGGLVLDRFFVHDPDFAEEPPPERIERVKRALTESLTTPGRYEPSFRRIWGRASAAGHAASRLPTQVRIDTATSDRLTIIDVFAADRQGLLFAIARALFEMGLSVSLAKIGTYLDQVVDVFYVTDQAGRKIDDAPRLEEIRTRLLAAIEAWEREQGER
jgi:[protein-PII] uridylyltransferase